MINTLNPATIGDAPTAEATPSDAERAEVERLVAAVKAGDRKAWLQSLHLPPPVPMLDLASTFPPSMSRDALSRESIYED